MRDTIELAREAGLIKTVDCCGVPDKFCGQDEWKGNLKVFAALVRADAIADEREEFQRWFDAVTAQHKAEILAEREACAKVCEDDALSSQYGERSKYRALLATAIRARGNT
jgi:hypothetical protein